MQDVGKHREGLGADRKGKWIGGRQRVEADEQDLRQKSKKKGYE
jgi:hypothetical protein